MNTLLLVTALSMGADYNLEDFHYYNESGQSSGLPFTNRIYVDLSSSEDKKNFLKFASANLRDMISFKDINTEDYNGLIITIKNKKNIIEALNICTDYPVRPIVFFDGVECTHQNEIIIGVQPSVNEESFTKRINSVIKGSFKIREVSPKVYLLKLDGLRNPSNALILANLIAKDNFWTRYARINWVPLDGYVKAIATIENPGRASLGEKRNFKLTIKVYDPNINVKLDLLPQTVAPVPFAGDDWIDSFPMDIQESSSERMKIVVVTYPFRYLQYGTYYFQPVIISYEKDGKLLTTKTDVVGYSPNQLATAEMIDLQELPNDRFLLPVNTMELPQFVSPSNVYSKYKIGSLVVCGSLGGLFLLSLVSTLRNKFNNWGKSHDNHVWSVLKHSTHDYQNLGVENYIAIASKLNKVMNEAFGVSLYSINIKECNANFRHLIAELNKVYEPDALLDSAELNKMVRKFCKERNYL